MTRKLMRKRTYGLAVTVALVFQFIASSGAAEASSVIDPVLSLSHIAPSAAVAGDPLVLQADVVTSCPLPAACSPAELTVRYTDAFGGAREVTSRGSKQSYQVLSVTIPGRDVRFPSVTYSLHASAEGCEEKVGSTLCSPMSASSPANGNHRAAVDNVLRMGFRNPNGAPAVGLRVYGAPQRNGAVWETVTDAAGVARLSVPAEDPYIRQRASEEGFVNILVSAFDNWPTVPPPGEEPEQRKGNGVDVAAVVNLGTAVLDAAPPMQDGTFTLRPQTFGFTNASSMPSSARDCSFDAGLLAFKCVEIKAVFPNVLEPVAQNVGGGVDMTSSFTFTDTTLTSQTIMVGGGSTWAETEGEFTVDESSSVTDGSRVWGPNDNRRYRIGIDHVQEETTICGLGTCYGREVVRPFTYAGNFEPDPPFSTYPEKHDEGRPMKMMAGSDCVSKVDRVKDTTSEVAVSDKMSFGVKVDGGDFGVPLHAKTKYASDNKSRKKAVHTWKVIDNPAQPFHHIYVPGGVVDADDPRTWKCPNRYPHLSWTDASYCEKTANPSNVTCGPVIAPGPVIPPGPVIAPQVGVGDSDDCAAPPGQGFPWNGPGSMSSRGGGVSISSRADGVCGGVRPTSS